MLASWIGTAVTRLGPRSSVWGFGLGSLTIVGTAPETTPSAEAEERPAIEFSSEMVLRSSSAAPLSNGACVVDAEGFVRLVRFAA